MTEGDNPRGSDFEGDLFDNMDKEFADFEETVSKLFKAINEMDPSKIDAGALPYSYGCQVAIDADGKLRVWEFGNAKPVEKNMMVERKEEGKAGAREPLVDSVVDEKGNILRITAEVPGISIDDIKIKISEKNVSILAENGSKKHHFDIPVEVQLDKKSVKATCSNGILDLQVGLKGKMARKRPVDGSSGIDVKVE